MNVCLRFNGTPSNSWSKETDKALNIAQGDKKEVQHRH